MTSENKESKEPAASSVSAPANETGGGSSNNNVGMAQYMENVCQDADKAWDAVKKQEKQAKKQKKKTDDDNDDGDEDGGAGPSDAASSSPRVISDTMKCNAALAFNSAAKQFLTDMLRLFPQDIILKQMTKELESHMPKPNGAPAIRPANIPALLFASQAATKIQVKNETDDDTEKESEDTVADMIMRRDIRLIHGTFSLQLLNAMGLKKKYPLLNEKNKKYIWSTLLQLLQLSSMVTLAQSDEGLVIDKLVGSMMAKSQRLMKGNIDIAKSPKTAAKLIAQDPQVRAAAREFAAVGNEKAPPSEKQIDDTVEAVLTGGQAFKQVLAEQAGMGKGNETQRSQAVKARLQRKLAQREEQRAAATSEPLSAEDATRFFDSDRISSHPPTAASSTKRQPKKKPSATGTDNNNRKGKQPEDEMFF